MIAGALHYQLDLPYGRPPAALWGNARNNHWGQRSTWSKHVRRDVMLLGRQAQIPQSSHLHVLLSWAPGDRRRRDSDNMWPMLKACCDGLARGSFKSKASGAHFIGLELVPDDTPHYMTKHAPVIVPPERSGGAKGMWLDIWAVPLAVEL
jgi:crossover junction endodeoxyribonuclease RusA